MIVLAWAAFTAAAALLTFAVVARHHGKRAPLDVILPAAAAFVAASGAVIMAALR